MNIELQRIWAETRVTLLPVTHGIDEAVFLAARSPVKPPGPGRITEVIEVPSPRPRLPALFSDPAFHCLCDRIAGALHGG